MKVDKVIPYLWKTPIFGLTLFLGLEGGDFFARLLGFEAPHSLLVFPPTTLALYILAISPILLATLLFLCRFVTGNYIAHWLTLSLLTWLFYSIGLSTSSGSTNSFFGLSPYVIIVVFFASFLGTGSIVLMFRVHYKPSAGKALG